MLNIHPCFWMYNVVIPLNIWQVPIVPKRDHEKFFQRVCRITQQVVFWRQPPFLRFQVPHKVRGSQNPAVMDRARISSVYMDERQILVTHHLFRTKKLQSLITYTHTHTHTHTHTLVANFWVWMSFLCLHMEQIAFGVNEPTWQLNNFVHSQHFKLKVKAPLLRRMKMISVPCGWLSNCSSRLAPLGQVTKPFATADC